MEEMMAQGSRRLGGQTGGWSYDVNEHLINRIAGIVVYRIQKAEKQRRDQISRFWLTFAAGAVVGVIFTWRYFSFVYHP